MPKMTGMDYAQYRYDLLTNLNGYPLTKEETEYWVAENRDAVGCGVVGYILGVGIFSLEEIDEYIDSSLIEPIHEIYQNKYWDDIDKG